MIKLLISIFISVISITCFGQIMLQNQVLAASGKTLSNSSLSMDFTLGEAFTNTLTVTNLNATQGFHQPNLKLINHAGVNEVSSFDLNVFPNPFVNQFTIALPSNEPVFIAIYDVLGKLIHQQHLSEIENVIDLSFLASGNYRIKYSSQNQLQTGNISIIKCNL